MQYLSQSQLTTNIHTKRTQSQHQFRSKHVSSSASNRYKPVPNSFNKQKYASENPGQRNKYAVSPEANLKRKNGFQQRQRIMRPISTDMDSQKLRVKSARKGTSPKRISQIHQFLRSGHSPRRKQLEEQNNRALIQKLLNIRCKVVTIPKNMVQSQIDLASSQTQPIKSQGPDQQKICDLLMKKLSPTLKLVQDKSDQQFKKLLQKKQLIEEEQSKPYNNQDIYINIRKSYQENPSPKKQSPILGHYQRQKQVLRKREEIFEKFTFKAKTRNMGKKQDQFKGW